MKKVQVQSECENQNSLQFKWYEYIILLFATQVGGLLDITEFITMGIRFGGVVFTSAYLGLYFLLGIPSLILVLFLGHFAQCGFIRLWTLSPLFKGVCITTIMHSLLKIAGNLVITSYALHYMTLAFKEVWPWFTCDFPNHSHDCVTFENPRELTFFRYCAPYIRSRKISLDAWVPQTVVYMNYSYAGLSSLEYFRYYVLNIPHGGEYPRSYGSVRVFLLIYCIITWTWVTLFAVMGFQKTRKLIVRAVVLSLCLGLAVFSVLLYEHLDTLEVGWYVFKVNYLTTDKETIWQLMYAHILVKTYPEMIIRIAGYAPTATIPNVDALVSSVVFVVLSYSLIYWTFYMFNVVLDVVVARDLHCMCYMGVEMIFGIVPDVILNKLPAHDLFFFIHFLAVYLWGSCNLIIEWTCIIDSFVDVFPNRKGVRWQCGLIGYPLVTLLILPLLTPATYLLRESFFFYVDSLITGTVVCLFFITVLWIYGVQRVRNDIDFMFRNKISMKFWIICWNFLPFINLIYMVLLLVQLGEMFDDMPDALDLPVLCGAVTIIILVPIPVWVIAHYFIMRGKPRGQNSIWILLPSQEWGPPDPDQKRARFRFNPKKRIRYKADKEKCHHACLRDSKRFRREVERLSANRLMYIEGLKSKSAAASELTTERGEELVIKGVKKRKGIIE